MKLYLDRSMCLLDWKTEDYSRICVFLISRGSVNRIRPKSYIKYKFLQFYYNEPTGAPDLQGFKYYFNSEVYRAMKIRLKEHSSEI